MAFADKPLFDNLVGRTVIGLTLSKTAAMTLEVATGDVLTHQDGVTHTLSAAQSKVFTADTTYPTRVRIALIDDGDTVDVWFDSFVDDGFNEHGDIPAGYTRIIDIAWFIIAANETDLANSTINRRTWL